MQFFAPRLTTNSAKSQGATVARRTVLLASAAMALAACGSSKTSTELAATTSTGAAAGPITIAHKQGTATLKATPTKVVVFDYSSLNTMDALGVAPIGLPKSNVPAFLEKYKADTYFDAGTLFEPNYEKVNEAQPDLIIVAGRSAKVFPELNKIAPTIDLTIDNKDFLGSVIKNSETIGKIFGKSAEVKTLVDALNQKITTTKTKAETAGTALIIMTNGGKVSAYGAGSRFAVVHDVLGIKPADPAIKEASHGDPVSFEYIKEKNPAMMFVVDRDSATAGKQGAAAKTLDNPLVKETDAMKNNKVVYVDSARWYLAGASVPDLNVMIDQVATAL